MIPPERFHPFEGRIPCVNGIVHATVEQVPKNKSGEKNKGIPLHGQEHDPKYQRGNDEAGNRWHEEPFLITGKMMVVSMHDIDELLCPLTVCNCVKIRRYLGLRTDE